MSQDILLREAHASLRQLTTIAATTAWWVPGRIEVLGKHTDYAGGRVLTCATNHGLVVVGAPRTDAQIRLISGDSQVVVGEAISDDRAPWAVYVDAVVNRLRANFPGPRPGVDIALASDLPPASGMSSSSALLLGLAAALAAVWKLDADPRWPQDFAGYAACIENGNDFGELRGNTGVGTTGGAMDHTAICGGRSGSLTCWSLAPTVRESDCMLPPGTALVVAVSGVLAEKTRAARESYNAVSQRARAALALWNTLSGRHDVTLAAAVNAGATAVKLTTGDLAHADLAQRLEQFIRESTVIVPTAARALAAGDLATFATVVAESQALSATHLRNQVPETIALVDLALAQGAYAASAFGSGFGGAVWALVPAAQRDAISATWLAAYLQRFPQRSTALVIHVEPGAGLHSIPLT